MCWLDSLYNDDKTSFKIFLIMNQPDTRVIFGML